MSATTSASNDFSRLPEVYFTEMETGKVEEAVIAIYEELTKRTLYPGDPERLFCTVMAAVIAQRNIILDQTGKQNLVRYAKGDFLDHIGAMLDALRLGAAAAETKERFSLAAPLGFPVTVPAGTRATGDANLFFAVTETAVIPAGDLHVDAVVAAAVTGVAGNGFLPGQINKLVDPVEHIVSVTNLTESSGGADVEEDDDFRYRIQLAPEKFTCAGSRESYIYFALAAHPAVQDVEAYSPTPGVVHVHVLLKGGIIPEPDSPVIAAVRDALSADKVRPLTDNLAVLPAEEITLDYRLTYYLYTRQAGYTAAIGSRIKAAAAEYELWQTSKLGRDINPDYLTSLCQTAGAKRIVAERLYRDGGGNIVRAEPMAFEELKPYQAVKVASRADRINFGALEDE